MTETFTVFLESGTLSAGAGFAVTSVCSPTVCRYMLHGERKVQACEGRRLIEVRFEKQVIFLSCENIHPLPRTSMARYRALRSQLQSSLLPRFSSWYPPSHTTSGDVTAEVGAGLFTFVLPSVGIVEAIE